MYGTIARLKISRENIAKLRDETERQLSRPVPGFRTSHVLVPDEREDEAYLVVLFDDRESYQKNADDPSQHQDYLKMRALLDADPEWIDGEWWTWSADAS
jgi:antibiotic biosynthesis monooxygenase (ABM) superfamily enzyme